MQKMDAIDLYTAFQNDKLEATSLYVGEKIVISGVVVYVGPEKMYGTPSIEVSDRHDGKTFALFCLGSMAEQRKAKKGDMVNISGECHVFDLGCVIFKKCKVLI